MLSSNLTALSSQGRCGFGFVVLASPARNFLTIDAVRLRDLAQAPNLMRETDGIYPRDRG